MRTAPTNKKKLLLKKNVLVKLTGRTASTQAYSADTYPQAPPTTTYPTTATGVVTGN